MGFIDNFNRTELNFSEITIDIGEDSLVINGAKIDIPSHIDVLIKLLGKPRKVIYRDNAQHVNYAWDDLGIYAFTQKGTIIFAVRILLNANSDRRIAHYPTNKFSGKLTICGKPWFYAAKKMPDYGQGIDMFKVLDLGHYAATIKYADGTQDDMTRTNKDYTSVEIQSR